MLPYAKLIELFIEGAKSGENFYVIGFPESKKFDVVKWELDVEIPTFEQLEEVYPKYLEKLDETPSEIEQLNQQVSELEITALEGRQLGKELAQQVSELEINILELQKNKEGVVE
ncbi:XkdW family protein [Bacillus thuringiensis]